MQVQVPVTHKINHLFNFLQNHPSSIALNLCKYSALFLALLATFHTIFIIKFPKKTPSLPPLIAEDDFGDSEDETCSLSSMSSEPEDNEEEEEEDENRSGEYFRLKGSGNGDGFLRSCRRSITDIFSLSEIANSKSVVKLWDTIGFGLGFGFDDFDSSVVSLYGGADEKQSTLSSARMVSAGENASENSALMIWDTRLRRRIPAVVTEWVPGNGNVVGIVSGGLEKVCVRDDGRYELTIL